jgi:uncharacterized protein YdhG (YjbR/CyaY superfamily)
MQPKAPAVASIDAYIADFPPKIRKLLQSVRKAIRAAAPDATERISYCMPTFYLHGNLVHFAACKHHIGFYPTPSGVAAFGEELAGYVTAKGSIQFPLDLPLPYDLIRKITAFRAAESRAKAGRKKPR